MRQRIRAFCRKNFLVTLTVLAFVWACPFAALAQYVLPNHDASYSKPIQTPTPLKPVLPSPQQLLWQDREQTMFVHISPATWQNRQLDDLSTPLSAINPSKLDVNQWIDAAESFGAKMILFTAKHTGGFCWWQTETTEYSIKNTPYKDGKGDVLDELAKACFARGMKLGIYIYPGDETWQSPIDSGGRTKDPAKQEGYSKALRQQWEEVLSRYGNMLAEIWFDGGLVIPLEDVIKQYAPQAVVFQGPFADIRWVGNERGICQYPNWYTLKEADAKTGVATGDHSDPDGDRYMPVEIDATLLTPTQWFWNTNTTDNIRTLEQLMDVYYTSVGRGAPLLLNSAPDTTGLIPEKDMQRYRAFGKEIRRRFGQSIAETSGQGDVVEVKLEPETQIDHVIIQEDLAFGQRVRQYAIEGLIGNEWKLITQGTSVGQKRIERFQPMKVNAVRFRILKSSFPPIIRRFAAFNTGVGNEATANDVKPEKNAGVLNTDGKGAFTFDLSPFIPLAEQYTIRIRQDNRLIKIRQAAVLLQGIEAPSFATVLEDGSVRLNITGFPDMKPESIIIKGQLDKNYGYDALTIYVQ
ncbi:MAG: alpha-L-fucosidase [Tannerellaceae bacterium]|jgi:alpha-L-fucosidase|nr:alpha-L-fucosidase [Tannerellaceae bacterium]